MSRHLPSALLLFVLSSAAQAQYQCKQAQGGTRFQQTPCAAGETQTALKLPPAGAQPVAPSAEQRRAQLDALDRRVAVRAAIEAGRPVVGMSLAELDLAMGQASELRAGQWGGDVVEERRYQRQGRQVSVTVQNGQVVAVQERSAAHKNRERPCATAREIRDLEIEISKIANRDNARLQADLQGRLAEARACR